MMISTQYVWLQHLFYFLYTGWGLEKEKTETSIQTVSETILFLSLKSHPRPHSRVLINPFSESHARIDLILSFLCVLNSDSVNSICLPLRLFSLKDDLHFGNNSLSIPSGNQLLGTVPLSLLTPPEWYIPNTEPSPVWLPFSCFFVKHHCYVHVAIPTWFNVGSEEPAEGAKRLFPSSQARQVLLSEFWQYL